GRATVVANVEVPRGASAGERLRLSDASEARLAEWVARLGAPHPLAPLAISDGVAPVPTVSRYPRDAFQRDVRRILDYIAAGDTFQTVLSRRQEAVGRADPLLLYRYLRALNPAPYLFYLGFDEFAVVGSSPEVLVRVEGGEVTVRPIAGTRPRGETPEEDEALARALVSDEKERAEHLMLVDLGRNDVGRVARYGTVRVTDLLTIERYSHVQHMVSEVRGRLKDGYDALDVFKACFPAGTVTGAPKVRAMEIIDELEPERRGPYAGAVGYVGWGATNLDTAIAIRCALVRPDRVVVQAGAGIVADSDPAREFRETEDKAQAVLKALALAKAGGGVYLAPVFKLLSTTGEQSIDLQPGRTIVVGRAVTSDVPIYDPTISRSHAEVSLTDGGVKVKDVGSSNGTFLNGARITDAIAAEN